MLTNLNEFYPIKFIDHSDDKKHRERRTVKKPLRYREDLGGDDMREWESVAKINDNSSGRSLRRSRASIPEEPRTAPKERVSRSKST